MAQAGQAPKITPSVTITISNKGIPDKASAKVVNHGIVEFTSKTEFAWEVSLLRIEGPGSYPVTILIPANDSAYLVANSPNDEDSCTYSILPLSACPTPPTPAEPKTNYVIIIGSGGGGPR